jgi:hypothetical protein
MVGKLNLGKNTFLVTSYNKEEQMVFKNHYEIIPPDFKFEGDFSLTIDRDNSYIEKTLKQELTTPTIIYQVNISACINLFNNLDLSGLVIPVGHADVNLLSKLKNVSLVEIPVFEAYKHYPGYRGYSGNLRNAEIIKMTELQRQEKIQTAFRDWIKKEF